LSPAITVARYSTVVNSGEPVSNGGHVKRNTPPATADKCKVDSGRGSGGARNVARGCEYSDHFDHPYAVRTRAANTYCSFHKRPTIR
jgi:hypothetical protein